MKFVHLNLAQRFVAYLLFLSIIPLLIVGFVAYRNSVSILQAESQRSTSQLISNQTDYLELRLGQMENLITNLSGIDEIRKSVNDPAAASNSFSSLSTQARIGYTLNNYINLLTGLVSIDIFTVDNTHYHVGDTLDVNSIRTDVRDNLFKDALASQKEITWVGIVENVNTNSAFDNVLTAAKVLYRLDNTTMKQDPSALLLINYSARELHQHFSQVDFGVGAYMLVVDNQGRLIYHPNEAMLGKPADSVLLKSLTGNDGVISELVVGGVPMSVTYKTLKETNWQIISLVPLATFNAQAAAVGGTLLYVLLISFAMVAFTAFLFSRTVVKPVREITERFKQLGNVPADQQEKLTARTQDEIGELVRWFNEFLDSLVIRQRTEKALIKRIQFEKIIAEAATRFTNVNSENIDKTIRETFLEISQVSEADRSYASMMDSGTTAPELRHQVFAWHAQGIESPAELDLTALPQSKQQLAKGRVVYLPDTTAMAEPFATDRQTLSARGVRSMVLIPMVSSDQLSGFIGFEALSETRTWDDETIALLSLIGQVVINAQDRIAAERDREALIHQLKESLVFKDQFLATMSHELRTPLNAIQGYAGLILLEDDLSEDVQYMTNRINLNSDRLLNLINDVLDISRINAQRIELVSRQIHLPDLVRSWYSDFKTQTDAAGLEFHLRLDPALPASIYGDEARLTQIAANLLQNAIKFTERGAITLSTKASEYTWSFSISDTGIGIAETWQHLIFDEFRQVDSSSKRKFGGAGLGLSIVKKLCLIMGGNITVTSKLGEGSTFMVVFPIEVAEQEKKEVVA